MTVAKCDKSNSSGSDSISGGGSIVGGGKRTKMQSESQSAICRGRSRQQPEVTIDKHKFYNSEQLTRPPLGRRTRRRLPHRNKQISRKLMFRDYVFA